MNADGNGKFSDAFVLDLDALGLVLFEAMRERPGEASALAASTVRPLEALGEEMREAARLLAAPVAREAIRAHIEQGARFSKDEWAGRYLALLTLVSDARLAANVEAVLSSIMYGHRVTHAPVSLLLARVLVFLSMLRVEAFEASSDRSLLYPGHAATCGVNSLGGFYPCTCGEAERIVAEARARAVEPKYADDVLHDIFATVHQGRTGNGQFVRAFAAAFMAADRDNKTLLRSAALALVDKYELHKFVEGGGRSDT